MASSSTPPKSKILNEQEHGSSLIFHEMGKYLSRSRGEIMSTAFTTPLLFRQHVERNLITPSSVTSNRSYRKGVPAIRFIENLKSDDGTILSDIQHERLNVSSCVETRSKCHEQGWLLNIT